MRHTLIAFHILTHPLVQVDIVGLETPQTGLAGRDDVETAQALIVRPHAHLAPHLGQDLRRVTSPAQRPPDDLLRAPLAVEVGGVQDTSASRASS